MGWEKCTRGQPRFVQKRRIGGKVTSQVLGYGEAGQQAEKERKQSKQHLNDLKADEKQFQQRLDQAETLFAKATDQHMILNGFIQRNRAWQNVKRLNHPLTTEERALIRRVQRKSTQICSATNENLQKFRLEIEPIMTSQEKLESFSNNPLTKEQRDDVQEMFRLDPDLWRELGDTTVWARNRAMRLVKGGTVQHECVKQGIEQMRKTLLEDGRSGLEVIAIEQLLTNYVQVGTTGYRLEDLEPGMSKTEEGKFWETRHHHAQDRLIKSMAVLARLRRARVDIFVTRNRNHTCEPTQYSNLDNASIK